MVHVPAATPVTVLPETVQTVVVWEVKDTGNPEVEQVANWRGQNLLGFALMEVRHRLRSHPNPTLPAGFVPLPWLRYPDIHPCSIGWRMGEGETYLMAFSTWWDALSEDERTQVEMVHPATGAWAGWYDRAE